MYIHIYIYIQYISILYIYIHTYMYYVHMAPSPGSSLAPPGSTSSPPSLPPCAAAACCMATSVLARSASDVSICTFVLVKLVNQVKLSTYRRYRGPRYSDICTFVLVKQGHCVPVGDTEDPDTGRRWFSAGEAEAMREGLACRPIAAARERERCSVTCVTTMNPAQERSLRPHTLAAYGLIH